MGQLLKIGIYSSQYPDVSGAGGIATYTRSLAIALAELGHEVHVLTRSASKFGPLEASTTIDGVRIHFIRPTHAPIVERWIPGGREVWQISARARQLAKEYALDIFEFPNWEGPGRFFKTAMTRTPPMVVRMHTSLREILELDHAKFDRAQRFACGLERDCCRIADSLYVSTAAHREHMSKELGIPESRIKIVPLGIPDVAAPEARTVRPRRTPPTLLYLGRMEKRKGTVELLNAVPEIARRVPDFRLVLIGKDREQAPGGISHQEYFKCAFPPALQKHVTFEGFLSDAEVDARFATADAFVAPSLYESFGLIFVEAMRWSLPVIGTTAGGISEVVDDGVYGFTVEPGSSSAIAEAAVKLLTDEPLRLSMGTLARKAYENKFSNRVMAQRTAEHYRDVIAGSAPAVKNSAPATAVLLPSSKGVASK